MHLPDEATLIARISAEAEISHEAATRALRAVHRVLLENYIRGILEDTASAHVGSITESISCRLKEPRGTSPDHRTSAWQTALPFSHAYSDPLPLILYNCERTIDSSHETSTESRSKQSFLSALNEQLSTDKTRLVSATLGRKGKSETYWKVTIDRSAEGISSRRIPIDTGADPYSFSSFRKIIQTLEQEEGSEAR